ncbi:MAG: hypothetical protein A3K77_04925 [Euryarchaeota archaeon RBG_13_31_8]|nr:MAG: hypothetical protein A3K77_04925 [Euryarchaeota archaeon RBG_13_31_8]
MVIWEYKVIELYWEEGKILDKNTKLLNDLGNDGWELVALADDDEYDGTIAYLKREKLLL